MDDIHAISLFGKKSYIDLFPTISLMDEKDYFILFDYFTIHLPIAGNWQENRELNLFEESVLRMLGIGNYDALTIAENLCMPSDLVGFIISRLEDKEYITKSKTITDKGTVYIGGETASDSANLTPAYVLVRRDTGEILPILFSRTSMVNTAEFNRDSRRVSITIGSTGKEETFSHRYIACKSTHSHKKMTNAEIHSIIRRHNNASKHPIYIPNDTHVEYSFDGSVFVHAKFILQEGYIDNILSSLGNSYHSPAVFDYALNVFPDLRTKIKKDAVSYMDKKSDKSGKRNAERYDMLYKYLNTKSGNNDYNTIDELNEHRANDAQTIRRLNAAVEWALSYHLREIGVPDTLVSALKAQTPQQNGVMLMEMAELAGLQSIKRHKNLFSYVSYSNFSAWRNGGEPSLALLLPIAAGVARRRSDSLLIPALLSLGKKASLGNDGLAFINRLANYGKAVRHGEKWTPIAGDTIQSLKDAILSFVNTLLPNFQESNKDLSVADSYGSVSQRKLNAEVQVLDIMGDFVFYGLPEKIRKLLIESVRLSEADDSAATITILSSVLEKEFLHKLNLKNCEPNLQNVFDRLRKREILPHGLSSVSSNFYNNAIHGEKSSLGASALAWVGSLADDVLDLVIQKKIIENVSEIAGMRGHGTGSINFTMDDIRAIQQRVYNIVKWLEEM